MAAGCEGSARGAVGFNLIAPVFKGSFIGIEYSLIWESGINELTFDPEQAGDIFYDNGHVFVQDIHVTPSPGPMARPFSLKH